MAGIPTQHELNIESRAAADRAAAERQALIEQDRRARESAAGPSQHELNIAARAATD